MRKEVNNTIHKNIGRYHISYNLDTQKGDITSDKDRGRYEFIFENGSIRTLPTSQLKVPFRVKLDAIYFIKSNEPKEVKHVEVEVIN